MCPPLKHVSRALICGARGKGKTTLAEKSTFAQMKPHKSHIFTTVQILRITEVLESEIFEFTHMTTGLRHRAGNVKLFFFLPVFSLLPNVK